MAEGLKISPTAWGPEPSSIMANVSTWSYIILIYYLALYHELRFWLAKKCWNSSSQGRPESFPISVLVIVITHSHIPQCPPKESRSIGMIILYVLAMKHQPALTPPTSYLGFISPLYIPLFVLLEFLLFFVEFLIFAVYFNPHWC